nr:YkgJ family cysteine cluster protein [Stenotrophomonas maltophilia]
MGTRQAPVAVQPDAEPAPIDCRRCDAVCCRLPVLLQPGDHVPGQFLSRDTHGRAVMARNEEGWCAAIDPYHLRCTIYSQRPAICRQFSMGGDDCRRERQDYLRQAESCALSSPST